MSAMASVEAGQLEVVGRGRPLLGLTDGPTLRFQKGPPTISRDRKGPAPSFGYWPRWAARRFKTVHQSNWELLPAWLVISPCRSARHAPNPKTASVRPRAGVVSFRGLITLPGWIAGPGRLRCAVSKRSRHSANDPGVSRDQIEQEGHVKRFLVNKMRWICNKRGRQPRRPPQPYHS